jgi:hypothetical protein
MAGLLPPIAEEPPYFPHSQANTANAEATHSAAVLTTRRRWRR